MIAEFIKKQKTSDGNIIKDEHREAFNVLFNHIYKEDEKAISLSMRLVEIAHVWDDLVDGDKVSTANINKAFIDSIFTLQAHEYWFPMGLNHQVLNVFLRWQDATTIENDPNKTEQDLEKTFMLRAGIYDIFSVIAYYLHGNEWALEVGPTIRRFYAETFKTLKEEFPCQTQ